MTGSRKSEVLLTLGFLGIISCVPLAQIALELRRGERVQFTDLFRYAPTVRNLRQYERTLEDKSWFQRAVRPEMQRLQLLALGDAGAKGLVGREGWLFYRPEVGILPTRTGERKIHNLQCR